MCIFQLSELFNTLGCKEEEYILAFQCPRDCFLTVLDPPRKAHRHHQASFQKIKPLAREKHSASPPAFQHFRGPIQFPGLDPCNTLQCETVFQMLWIWCVRSFKLIHEFWGFSPSSNTSSPDCIFAPCIWRKTIWAKKAEWAQTFSPEVRSNLLELAWGFQLFQQNNPGLIPSTFKLLSSSEKRLKVWNIKLVRLWSSFRC